MTTNDVRPDPLAFLGEELDDLRNRHLYRPLRVMSSAQGPIVSVDERRLISLVLERLPRADPPPAAAGCGAAAVRDFGAGSGAVRTIAGTMTLHEELERDLAAFKGTEATLTFQSGFTANTGVIPTITGEQDLIVSDELNHASIIDGMRLSKAPRKIYPHARRRRPPGDPRRGRRARPRGHRAPLSADPRRHRRRLQHGRRHRAAARDRRGGRVGRTPPSSSTTPTPRASSAATAAARSTTSGSTAAWRSRSGRSARRSASSAATWPARRTSATS